MGELRLLVLSDLHAFTPSEKINQAPSFLLISVVPGSERPNPLTLVPEVLAKEGLAVDWVLCPGDIADRADPNAQAFAWAQLEMIRVKLKARLLLGTAGNHDIDSRLKIDGFDPKGHLLGLNPPFPCLNEDAVNKYWARNFHVLTEHPFRLVNLNSAAFHGFRSDEQRDAVKSEYRHGRVSAATIREIINIVSKDAFPINILFTHHHPYKCEHIYSDDYSEMTLGGKLVNEITEITNSSWLVIHGHMHYPEIYYGQSKVHHPVIFRQEAFPRHSLPPYLLTPQINSTTLRSTQIKKQQRTGGPAGQ